MIKRVNIWAMWFYAKNIHAENLKIMRNDERKITKLIGCQDLSLVKE